MRRRARWSLSMACSAMLTDSPELAGNRMLRGRFEHVSFVIAILAKFKKDANSQHTQTSMILRI